MDKKIENLFKAWQERNILSAYCKNKEEALRAVLKIIPASSSIGLSGSVTLDQLGVAKALEDRGNKVFNQYKAGISKEENLELRRQGVQADYYLASANAISLTGELVFFSAYGNRTAGIANAKNVLVICGVNKLTPNIQAALKRAREYSTPLNCKRLNWNAPCLKDGVCREEACITPDYKRMCCQVLVIGSEVALGRLQVILVDEELGF